MREHFLKQLLYVVLFAFTTSVSTAQTIQLGKSDSFNSDENFFTSVLHPLRNQIWFFQNDSIKIIDIDNFNIVKSVPISFSSDFIPKDYEMVLSGDKIYFVNNYGGKVFQFISDSLIRRDNSNTNRMQNESSIFVNNGVIYRYGGYGFWSTRNMFTYFDDSTKDWELFHASGSDVFPRGSFSSHFIQTDSVWYLFGGKYIDQKQPYEPKRFNELWKFNVDKLKWTKLGDYSIDVFPLLKAIKYLDKVLVVMKDELLLIDIPSNSVDIFENDIIGDNVRQLYFNRGYFYIVESDESTKEIALRRVDSSKLFTKKIGSREIVHKDLNIGIWSLLASLILISLVAGYILRKRKLRKSKIRLLGNSLLFKNSTFELTDEMKHILDALIRKNEVTTGDLTDIIKNENLHPTQNLRILHHNINELNLKLRLLTGVHHNMIENVKSETDKRIKVYKLDKSLFYLPVSK